jgi:hypothetical protein
VTELTSISRPNRQKNLTYVHTRHETVRFAKGTTHTRLQSIGTGARQHLIDADNMVRVDADTHVEAFLTGDLDEILVGADAGGFEGFGGQLLILVGDEVDTCWEVVDGGALAAEIVDADLGVGDTAVEAGLGVWLVLWVVLVVILFVA